MHIEDMVEELHHWERKVFFLFTDKNVMLYTQVQEIFKTNILCSMYLTLYGKMQRNGGRITWQAGFNMPDKTMNENWREWRCRYILHLIRTNINYFMSSHRVYSQIDSSKKNFNLFRKILSVHKAFLKSIQANIFDEQQIFFHKSRTHVSSLL